MNRDTLPLGVVERLRSGVYQPVNDMDAFAFRDPSPASGRAREVAEAQSPAPRELGRAALPPEESLPKRAPSSARSDATPAFKPGDVFRSYVVGAEFAQGGMSVLYSAMHTGSGRNALIKVLKPYYRQPHYRAVQEKLVAEGELLMNAGGRNSFLVPVHDFGRDDKVGPFVIMDKLEGRTLLTLIQMQRARSASFEPASVARTGISLADGLHTMHITGAVHRDIKPANIFVMDAPAGGDPRFVLLDWGCAKSAYTAHTTNDQATMGTAAYMAPEQLLRRPVTGAIDQYALAMVLYEMLRGRHPHHENGPLDAEGHLARHLHEPIPEPPTHFVSAGLWHILRRALEKEPERRYPSCAHLAEALRAWLASPDELTAKPERLLREIRRTVPKSPDARRSPQSSIDPPVDVVAPAKRIGLTDLSHQVTIVIRTGATAGARYELTGRHVLGRHPAHAHIVIEDDGVSSMHAVVQPVVADPNEPVFTIADLGSLNGTAVDGIPLGNGGASGYAAVGTLHAGTRFQLDQVEAALMPAGRLGGDGEWQTPKQAELFDRSKEVPKRTMNGGSPPAQPIAAQPARVVAPAASQNRDFNPRRPISHEDHLAARRDAERKLREAGASPVPPLVVRPALAVGNRLPQRSAIGLNATSVEPTLLLLWGEHHARVVLEDKGVIGSDAERANITIAERHVSGAHAMYASLGGAAPGEIQYLIEDMNSTNGLLVSRNDKLDKVTSIALRPFDRVWLGPELELVLLPPGLIENGDVIRVDDAGKRVGRMTAGAAPTAAPVPPVRRGRGLAILATVLGAVLAFWLLDMLLVRVLHIDLLGTLTEAR